MDRSSLHWIWPFGANKQRHEQSAFFALNCWFQLFIFAFDLVTGINEFATFHLQSDVAQVLLDEIH